jgi:hypothetical protein
VDEEALAVVVVAEPPSSHAASPALSKRRMATGDRYRCSGMVVL